MGTWKSWKSENRPQDPRYTFTQECVKWTQSHQRLTHELYQLWTRRSAEYGDEPEVSSQKDPQHVLVRQHPDTEQETASNEAQQEGCPECEQRRRKEDAARRTTSAASSSSCSSSSSLLRSMSSVTPSARWCVSAQARVRRSLSCSLSTFSSFSNSWRRRNLRALEPRASSAASCGKAHDGAPSAALLDRTASTSGGSGSSRTPGRRAPRELTVFS